jgi:hypothetical protein
MVYSCILSYSIRGGAELSPLAKCSIILALEGGGIAIFGGPAPKAFIPRNLDFFPLVILQINFLSGYEGLVKKISASYATAQAKAVNVVNASLLDAYWQIGRYIVEYEQKGSAKAVYGKKLLEILSKDFSLMHGKGFSLSNLKRMRQLYSLYSIGAKPSHQLSWSHYVELLKIDDPLERNFYEKQAILENWSIPELIRQKKTSLFLRLAASKDKDGIMKLSQKGQIVQQSLAP